MESDDDTVDTASQAICYGDSAAADLAVVELYRNSESYCTGFFITRRHIVTTAYCRDSYYASQWYTVWIKTGYAILYDNVSWIENTLKISYGSLLSYNRFGSGFDAYMRCF